MLNFKTLEIEELDPEILAEMRQERADEAREMMAEMSVRDPHYEQKQEDLRKLSTNPY